MARQSKAAFSKISPRKKGLSSKRIQLGPRLTLKKGRCSKSQLRTALVISHILCGEKYVMETTWDWLLSDKNTTMYLDIYFPALKLAVEYHGEQHFKFPNFFHKTQKEFKDAQKRDSIKKKLLKKHSIKLIEWKYNETITEEKAYTKLIAAGVPKSKLRTPQAFKTKKRSKVTKILPRRR
ncbi:hypothetical protein H8D85_02295 [bacterium]|nr:hypothetical protein [bacterium]